MPRIESTNSKGEKIWFEEEEGVYFSPVALKLMKPPGDLKAHVKSVRELDIRPDDIFISTFKKSGTHWIWEIVSMVTKNGANYSSDVKESAMIEFLTPEELGQLPSPRILNCHYPLHLTPKGVVEKKCKIIHVWRNIKDVMVSLLNHMSTMMKVKGLPPPTLEDILATTLGEPGFCVPYPWFKYVQEWIDLAKERPDQVLNLTFEDLKKDSATEIKKVARFLGKECSDELAAEIADKCSFKKLKQANQDVKTGKKPEGLKDMDFMYRKGEVGDWKNWFTVAQNERIDRWLEENLKDTDLKVKFTL